MQYFLLLNVIYAHWMYLIALNVYALNVIEYRSFCFWMTNEWPANECFVTKLNSPERLEKAQDTSNWHQRCCPRRRSLLERLELIDTSGIEQHHQRSDTPISDPAARKSPKTLRRTLPFCQEETVRNEGNRATHYRARFRRDNPSRRNWDSTQNFHTLEKYCWNVCTQRLLKKGRMLPYRLSANVLLICIGTVI